MAAHVDLLKPVSWPVWARLFVPACLIALLIVLFFYPSAKAPTVRPLVVSVQPTPDDPVAVRARLERNLLDGTSDSEDLQLWVQNTGRAPLRSLQLQVVAPGFTLERNADGTPALSPAFAALPTELAPGADYTFHIRVRPAADSGSYGITTTVHWQRTPVTAGAGSTADGKLAVSESASGGRSLFVGPMLFEGTFGAARFGRLGQRVASALKDLTLPILLLLLTNYFTRRQELKDEADRNAQTERAEKQQVRQLLLGRVMEYAERAYLPMMSAASGATDECDSLCRGAGGDPLRVVYFLLKLHLTSERQRKANAGVFLQSREAERIVQAALLVSRVAIRAVLTPLELRAATRRSELLDDFETFRSGGSSLFHSAANRLQAWVQKDAASAYAEHGDIEGFVGALDALQAVLRYETNRPFMQYWYDDPAIWEFRLAKSVLPEDGQVPQANLAYLQKLREAITTHCGRVL